MRKPNIDLKKINLDKAHLQLSQLSERVDNLKIKLADLTNKYNNKLEAVQALENEISQLEAEQNATTQNEIQYPLGTPSNLQ